MDDYSADDMTSLAAVSRPRPAMPVGQALPANGEDWTLDHLRGQPLPEAKAIVYVLAFARRQTFLHQRGGGYCRCLRLQISD